MFEINTFNIGVVIAILIITVPFLSVILGFLGCLVWMFLDRLDYMPDNPVNKLFKKLNGKPKLPDGYTLLQRETDGRFYIKRSDGKFWDGWATSEDSSYKPNHVFRRSFKTEEDAIEEFLIKSGSYPIPWPAKVFWMALIVFLMSACLHWIFWQTVWIASVIGVIFMARWIRDLQKYAVNVMDKLNKHQEDPNAHKSEAPQER